MIENNSKNDYDNQLNKVNKKRKRYDTVFSLVNKLVSNGAISGVTDTTTDTSSAISNLLNIINLMKLECQLCNKNFPTKPQLKQHIVHVHKINFDDYMTKFHNPSNGGAFYNKQQQHQQKKSSSASKDEINIGRKRKNSANSSISSLSNKTTTSSSNLSEHTIAKLKSNGENGVAKKFKISESESTATDDEADEEIFDEDVEEEEMMQAFLIENEQSNDSNKSSLLMQPCVVYLPVKTKIKETIVAKFRLKPVPQGLSKRVKSTNAGSVEKSLTSKQIDQESVEKKSEVAENENINIEQDNDHDNQEVVREVVEEEAAEEVEEGVVAPTSLQLPLQQQTEGLTS